MKWKTHSRGLTWARCQNFKNVFIIFSPTIIHTCAIWYLSVTRILPICTCSHIHLLLLGRSKWMWEQPPIIFLVIFLEVPKNEGQSNKHNLSALNLSVLHFQIPLWNFLISVLYNDLLFWYLNRLVLYLWGKQKRQLLNILLFSFILVKPYKKEKAWFGYLVLMVLLLRKWLEKRSYLQSFCLRVVKISYSGRKKILHFRNNTLHLLLF